MKKDQQFIRQGMIQGILPIGTVYKRRVKVSMIITSVQNFFGSILVIFTRVLSMKSKKPV